MGKDTNMGGIMENNFICPKTKEEYFVPQYTVRAGSTGVRYFDKMSGEEIVSKDGTILEPIKRA